MTRTNFQTFILHFNVTSSFLAEKQPKYPINATPLLDFGTKITDDGQKIGLRKLQKIINVSINVPINVQINVLQKNALRRNIN